MESMYLSNKELMHNGTMRDIHTLINALFIHILTVFDAAHKPDRLSNQEVALGEAACEHTRQLFVISKAKAPFGAMCGCIIVLSFSGNWQPCFSSWGMVWRDAIVH